MKKISYLFGIVLIFTMMIIAPATIGAEVSDSDLSIYEPDEEEHPEPSEEEHPDPT